ncbi:SDR family NAD(P)-dependent oxidoreductase [Mycobacterium sp. 050134]|uniref:SDR family NAD(P)-dependent oxidoreductase n=1 Tax=Mycobacterium sp. 050134 TaxID=3096111 RepID=UPI002ED7F0FE
MTHRTIVIAGASDGIGAAAARRLSRSGENVVVGRSEGKTKAVAAELGADYFVVDFADLTQVRAVADKIRSEYPRIDVLANNAGGMCREVEITADGYWARGLSAATFPPGYVNSNFGDASGSRMLLFMKNYVPITARFTSTADEGADQLVWLASTTPGVDWAAGEYYSKGRVGRANRAAYNAELARELWDRTSARLG